MTPLRILYLVLVALGVYMPMRYFIAWFNEHGYSLSKMVDAWHANAASSGLVWDLTIAAVTLTVWIIADSAKRKDWTAGIICILSTWGIGVSCGLPLFLFYRSRQRG